jgi:Zn-dependent M28 family amino/carboxypeptidase
MKFFSASIFTFLTVFNINAQSDTVRIRKNLKSIIETESFRHFMNPQILDEVAAFIFEQFEPYADTVYYQDYSFNGARFRNVIASFGVNKPETIVIGAHYDVCGQQAGADDNASGVAGLLELAVMLAKKSPEQRIDLVAYTLEEPPYFRTENMGSYQHAKMLFDEKRKVAGMISVEMIAYFSDEKRSQDYPLGIMKLFYGNKGNFITLVNKFGKGEFARKYTRKFKSLKIVKSKKITGPAVIPGIDFSDHLNYWKFGYSALMITDTAFYRNKNYHMSSDTIETLDIPTMAKVIDNLYEALFQ